MSDPVTTRTDEDDAILRFLKAAELRIQNHSGRVPFDSRTGLLVTSWLRGLVGSINQDGTLGSK